jgi:hypothetical protein
MLSSSGAKVGSTYTVVSDRDSSFQSLESLRLSTASKFAPNGRK